MAVDRKYERDVDLLLAEELAVSPAFAAWFRKQTRFADSEAGLVDVFVSRSDATGESDLVAIYEEADAGRRFALLVEDKIDAPMQPDQAARYRLRAQREMERGDYQAFETILCAPASYAASHPESAGFDSIVTYQAISEFLRAQDRSARGAYRANFLATAAMRNANTWTRVSDERTNRFWTAAYELARAEFTALELKPLALTKDSSWITIRPDDLPTKPIWTYVSLKGDRGCIDLTFTGANAAAFVDAIAALVEPGMSIHRTGKSAAIRITTDRFTPSEELQAALPKVRAAFAASERLVRFYRVHRLALDRAALAARAS